jgi:hypothetical protein
MDLTPREWASLLWFGIFVAWMLSMPSIRRSLLALLRATVALPILLSGGLFAIYVEGLAYAGGRLGIWDVSLAKDTIAWFVVAGLALYGKFSRVGERKLLRRELLTMMTVPALLTVIFGTVSFPFWVEFLLLQPVLVVVPALVLVAGWKRDTQIVATFGNRFLQIVGLLVLLGTTAQIIGNWQSFAGPHLVLQLYLPFWLTGGAAMFVYVLGRYEKWHEDRLIRREVEP